MRCDIGSDILEPGEIAVPQPDPSQVLILMLTWFWTLTLPSVFGGQHYLWEDPGVWANLMPSYRRRKRPASLVLSHLAGHGPKLMLSSDPRAYSTLGPGWWE